MTGLLETRETEHPQEKSELPTWITQPFANALDGYMGAALDEIAEGAKALGQYRYAQLIGESVANFRSLIYYLATKKVTVVPLFDRWGFDLPKTPVSAPTEKPTIPDGLVRITGDTLLKLQAATAHHGGNTISPAVGFTELLARDPSENIRQKARNMLTAVDTVQNTLVLMSYANEIHLTTKNGITTMQVLTPIESVRPIRR